ncbi:Biliverdin reductase [Lentibacillus sp. JNUCC-1]|uniref:Gfo/Idh/MocA family protein n=1 Tax=Lentibacillus sp. JNUCC-1 TaxID=2654513 RepID=UPI0012E7FAD2|nr:Gfo/Idh/MocA family oxidoreductase [Lentibacillus sp. JNUCC-1]MUV37602.1 Biliverdin reductase [Lentibacillus sp. JNUCC-1]
MSGYKVGIIGTGFGARVHAPMMKVHDGFEVVALASVRGNTEAAKTLSGIHNVYTNWKKILDHESLDLLVVASAVFAHKEMVEEAYSRGIHVLCEKPMALTHNETTDMIEARDQAGKLGFINHEFRFLPARTEVKKMIEAGKLGNIMHIRYEYTHPAYQPLTSKKRGWLGQKEDGGGLLNALGSHMIDSLHWWTDSSFKALNAHLMTHIPEFKDENGKVEHRTADDAFHVIGTLKNNTTVTLDLVSAARKAQHGKRLEIYGDEGTLVMLDDAQLLFAKEDQAFEAIELNSLAVPETLPSAAAPYYNGLKPLLDALYETLESGDQHPYLASFENGQTTQKVLDAIRRSDREGRQVTL